MKGILYSFIGVIIGLTLIGVGYFLFYPDNSTNTSVKDLISELDLFQEKESEKDQNGEEEDKKEEITEEIIKIPSYKLNEDLIKQFESKGLVSFGVRNPVSIPTISVVEEGEEEGEEEVVEREEREEEVNREEIREEIEEETKEEEELEVNNDTSEPKSEYGVINNSDNETVQDSQSGQLSISNTPLHFPIPSGYSISSPYGLREVEELFDSPDFHRGVDFATPTGTPVYAVLDGTVETVTFDTGGGNVLVTKHEVADGKTIKTLSAHLDEILVVEGDVVVKGQTIAKTGNTGVYTTGPHLHFELYYDNILLDPMLYLEK